jgi:predicted enzyme related to lactoylglutathione lyase
VTVPSLLFRRIFATPKLLITFELQVVPQKVLGYLRVTFAVEDIDETLERLRNRGAQLMCEVVQYKDAYLALLHPRA